MVPIVGGGAVLALSLVASLMSGGASLENLVNARDSLGALNGFGIVVDLDAVATQAGIGRRAVVAQVENALRKSAIHVYRHVGNETNDPGTPGMEGQLRVELVGVNGSVGADPFVVVRYDVAISQWVHLEADTSASAFARTWATRWSADRTSEKAENMTRDALEGSLEVFCAEYAPARAYWLAKQRAKAAEGGR